MVKGGKLYYASGEVDEEEELVYTELMDITPGTYKFKRLMNFHFMEKAIYSDFIVMDDSGSELAKAEDVPAPAFKYITEIGFAVEKADKAVIVDDFKIYLTSAAADFSVYDARSGRNAELDETRNRSTAYRLSWLNASTTLQTATIKADITANGTTTTTVLKEVKMIPGNDGVETGIVEIKEGETVKVYMETSLKAPEEPVEDEATVPSEPEGDSFGPGGAPIQPTTSGKAPTAIRVTRPTEAPAETQAPTEEPTEAPTEAPVEIPTEAPTEAPTVAPTVEATEAPDETEEPEETKADKDKDDDDEEVGPNVVLIVVIAVVALAGVGAAVYFLVIKKKKA